jgi:hypothetical protein
MSPFSLPRLLSIFPLLCALAGLTACGGSVDAGPNTTMSATASVVVANAAPMPVADCAPQACAGLRIIDSNAETFRVDSARRDALALAVAKLGGEPYPVQ